MRFGAVEIVPEWVEMIKTELIGMEYGGLMGRSGVLRANMLSFMTISVTVPT